MKQVAGGTALNTAQAVKSVVNVAGRSAITTPRGFTAVSTNVFTSPVDAEDDAFGVNFNCT